MQGQKVYHPRLGSGLIRKSRRSGLEYLVLFADGVEKWVRMDELDKFTPKLHQPELSIFNGKKSANFLERKLIEALRMGIVPDEGLELFTIGREPEIATLKEWLVGEDSALLIIGEYGSGKTHMLTFFQQIAIQESYAVAFVSIDPDETPFSKPKRIYHEIMRSLRWQNGNKESNAQELIEMGLAYGYMRDHLYFKHLGRTNEDAIWEWIMAETDAIRPISSHPYATKLPGLYNYTSAANIYCYLLSGLGWLCSTPEIDLKGLLILFDESEALHAARNYYHLERGVNFLDALIATARGELHLLDSPLFAEFKSAYHASNIPFLYKPNTGLKLVFAFTAWEDLLLTDEAWTLYGLELQPLHLDHFDTVMEKLQELYKSAYQCEYSDFDVESHNVLLEELEWLKPRLNTRAIVKGYLEALDIARFGTYEEDDDW